MTSLWTEKYRPKDPKDFSAPKHIKNLLEHSLVHGFPHLLLYGPPGTGKTTFAHLLSGKNFLELNASDERGIATVRTRIKTYASSISSKNVIILDECELLTPDAQHCLRRVIEDYPQTRFIFITNYISRIIEPLKSRLLKLKFDLFDTSEVLERIATQEKVDSASIKKLYRYCNYDLRRAINTLQGIAPLKNSSLEEVLGIIDDEVIDAFWKVTFEGLEPFVSSFSREGHSLIQLIHQLAASLQGDDMQKARFSQALSLVEGRAVLGCTEEILLRLLCCKKLDIHG